MKKENINMKEMVGLEILEPLIKKAMEYQNIGFGTVFIDIQGQVNILEIRIYTLGWRSWKTMDFKIEVPIGKDEFDEKELNEALERLNEHFKKTSTYEKRLIKDDANKKLIRFKQYQELKKEFGDIEDANNSEYLPF